MHFRNARAADLTQVARHVHDAYRGERSRQGWTTEADLLDGQRTDTEQLAALVASPSAWIVLAQVGEALVGSMLLSLEADTLHVGMLAVAPTEQRKGYGSALLREAELRGRGLSCWVLRMTVIAQRAELIAWYVRHGYRRTGEREPFPYGDPRFGLPRRADLYFEVLNKTLTRDAL